MNLKIVDKYLDQITMYRLALYYLLLLLGGAMVLGAFGALPYSPMAIAFSASYITFICWLTNKVFAYVYKTPVNYESPLITALILALIISPLADPHNYLFLTAAGGLAIASKYILSIRKKHIFNPAAVAVALTAFGAGQSASWWVGNRKLLPLVIIGGVLLVRKIQRGQMVVSFLAAVMVATIFNYAIAGGDILGGLQKTVLDSSVFFLAFIMLTEPLTSPATVKNQRWYGILTGLLFPPQVHLGSLYSTPELVLLVGNIFSYVVSPKVKLLPKLVQRLKLTPDTMDFIFTPNRKFSYRPGQYMEWTLPHEHSDSRGARRYFTLASSPTEKNVRLGVKFYDKGSTYKKALMAMRSDTPIAAAQLGGDFVLPRNKKKKLVFIAGGIGITPFRSMLKFLVDTRDARDVTVFYSERTAKQVVYIDVLEEARQILGTKVIYTLTNQDPVPNWARSGLITSDMIRAEVPDFRERSFYISGPHSMVTAMTEILTELGVSENHIKTDFFPGYA